MEAPSQPPRFTTRLRVRYAETDAAGVVYYGNYLTYFEVVRVELLRALGYPITAIEERGVLLPVVEARLEYLRPARLDDLLEVSAERGVHRSGLVRLRLRGHPGRSPARRRVDAARRLRARYGASHADAGLAA